MCHKASNQSRWIKLQKCKSYTCRAATLHVLHSTPSCFSSRCVPVVLETRNFRVPTRDFQFRGGVPASSKTSEVEPHQRRLQSRSTRSWRRTVLPSSDFRCVETLKPPTRKSEDGISHRRVHVERTASLPASSLVRRRGQSPHQPADWSDRSAALRSDWLSDSGGRSVTFSGSPCWGEEENKREKTNGKTLRFTEKIK